LLVSVGPSIIEERPTGLPGPPEPIAAISGLWKSAEPDIYEFDEHLEFVPTDATLVAWPIGTVYPFLRTGHSLFALIAALLGGLAARYFHDTMTPQRPARGGEAP
jgi:hypothetical protein